jgi:Contractile injection system tube protein/LysM domain
MERVAFLVEKTGERIPCLLNPTSVVVRRLAGVRARQSSAGPLTGSALKDDPLLHTGGGMTEILLDLVFDVSLAGANVTVEDVRDLTRPLTELAEGSEGDDGYGQVPLVRFVWGKSWNILGVVAAVAERLEYFTAEGAPQRSWLRMRLLRVGTPPGEGPAATDSDLSLSDLPDEIEVPPDQLRVHRIQGQGEDNEGQASTVRLDEIAASFYGNPAWWRLIAAFNNIDSPGDLKAGTVLNIPPDSCVGGRT